MTGRTAKGGRRIRSIEVGFRLIRVLEHAGGPLPLGVLAERAQMPASKAHLYMVSFVDQGLVTQDPATMRYGLGPYALQLGAAAVRQLDVARLAAGAMSRLQERTGLVVVLSVWGNRGPVVVSRVDGADDWLVAVRVGYVLPLLRSATGRVFYAHLPPASVRPVLAIEDERDPDVRRRAEESLPEIRRTGVALADGQVNAGFAAVSAPVFDYAGDIAAAITALGLRTGVDLDPDGPLAALVRATAAEIGVALGHRPDAPAAADGPPPPPARRRSAR